ncbi:hypothetical protein GGR51DRAFT_174867 [Nemania sp. FL0031]|nr:hypothetical protein GGR51DRAFT_174867 [Nemania sp. FL0031]
MISGAYIISEETKEELTKFKKATNSVSTTNAIIYSIDKDTLEIKRDQPRVFKSLKAVAKKLGNVPRYIVVAYPLTLSSGLKPVRYVFLYYNPPCKAEINVPYADAKESMHKVSGTGRILDIQSPEGLKDVPILLGGNEREDWKKKDGDKDKDEDKDEDEDEDEEEDDSEWDDLE